MVYIYIIYIWLVHAVGWCGVCCSPVTTSEYRYDMTHTLRCETLILLMRSGVQRADPTTPNHQQHNKQQTTTTTTTNNNNNAGIDSRMYRVCFEYIE
jgi:hypothetical protein